VPSSSSETTWSINQPRWLSLMRLCLVCVSVQFSGRNFHLWRPTSSQHLKPKRLLMCSSKRSMHPRSYFFLTLPQMLYLCLLFFFFFFFIFFYDGDVIRLELIRPGVQHICPSTGHEAQSLCLERARWGSSTDCGESWTYWVIWDWG
jgi:hypothetical protein